MNLKKGKSYYDGMHKGAKPETFKKAKYLRNNMTKAEQVLWEKLRKKETIGYRFRRQHPLGYYILDFYNHQLKLCIEIDGKYHQNLEVRKNDLEREEFLDFNGIKTIRFKNEDVLNDTNKVIESIKTEISNLN